MLLDTPRLDRSQQSPTSPQAGTSLGKLPEEGVQRAPRREAEWEGAAGAAARGIGSWQPLLGLPAGWSVIACLLNSRFSRLSDSCSYAEPGLPEHHPPNPPAAGGGSAVLSPPGRNKAAEFKF